MIQGKIRIHGFKLPVLFLERFVLGKLIDLHAAILFTPIIEGCFVDTQFPADSNDLFAGVRAVVRTP